MSLTRRILGIAIFTLLAFSLATVAQAKNFSLTGGGGQLQIGNGLALPIQQAPTSATTGTVFPNLNIPPVAGAKVSGTIVKPLLTAMATSAGPVTKQGYQRKLAVPIGVLSKPAAQTTVGVKFSNTALFAVATNLNYVWPAAPAVFSTGAAIATNVVAFAGGTMTYSNTLGQKFGGAAQFAINPGAPAGLYTNAPVTIYLKINGATPPCTHTAFGGAPVATPVQCVAGMMLAKPTGVGGAGGPTSVTAMTPGQVIYPAANVAILKMGLVPSGNISKAVLAAANSKIPTNMATSQGAPWTTGQVIISQPAVGVSEMFTLTGKDDRTAGGEGAIQFVAGALSARTASGPNANRGWVRLELGPNADVPAVSPAMLVAGAGLILLAFGYATRQRFSAVVKG